MDKQFHKEDGQSMSLSRTHSGRFHLTVLAMQFIWTLIIGLVVGVIAKFLTPGRDPGGCLITTAIGIAGAFIATFLGQTFHFYAPDQAAGFIGSVVGAVILLLVYHAFRSKPD